MRRIHSPVGFTSTYSLCTDLKSSLVIPTISGKYWQASIHSNTKHLQRVYICMRILLRLLSLCLSPLCRHVELLYSKFMRDPQFYVGYNWLSDYFWKVLSFPMQLYLNYEFSFLPPSFVQFGNIHSSTLKRQASNKHTTYIVVNVMIVEQEQKKSRRLF